MLNLLRLRPSRCLTQFLPSSTCLTVPLCSSFSVLNISSHSFPVSAQIPSSFTSPSLAGGRSYSTGAFRPSLSLLKGVGGDSGQDSKDDDVSDGTSAEEVEKDKETEEVEEEEGEEEEEEEDELVSADDDTAVPSTRLKYKTPKKRASMLLSIIKKEQEEKSKAAKPKVFDVDFAVGDSVELEYASTVDTKTRTISKVRGVLIAVRNKGIATNIVIRDIVLDEVVEREIPLHSPLVLSLKVLTKNFVKGRQKKRIKRAKLYYLRDRPDAEVRVTGSGQ